MHHLTANAKIDEWGRCFETGPYRRQLTATTCQNTIGMTDQTKDPQETDIALHKNSCQELNRIRNRNATLTP